MLKLSVKRAKILFEMPKAKCLERLASNTKYEKFVLKIRCGSQK